MLLATAGSSLGFVLPPRPTPVLRREAAGPRLSHLTATAAVPWLAPDKVAEITEPACQKMMSSIEVAQVEMPSTLATGLVGASYVRTTCAPSPEVPPVVLCHSFDSSCLEFRRLLPELEEMGVEAYALDIFGWGFADTTNATSVGVSAKREHLLSFSRSVLGGRPMTLVGVSLGAAVIIDFYAAHPEAVASTVLVDPQGFIDGAPPVPEPFARGGIRVLGSWPLRSFGQQLAYYDTDKLATDDAIRIGKLHCARPGWEDDSVEWLLGGGYSVSTLVPKLRATPCLVLWGRQDQILPPADYLPKFVAALPDAQFRWIEECGHTPHLEQPKFLANAIRAALDGTPVAGDADVSEVVAAAQRNPLQRLNALLDTPLLDTNVRGGPLEPFKKFARVEPEAAQAAASVVAVLFWFAVFRALAPLFF